MSPLSQLQLANQKLDKIINAQEKGVKLSKETSSYLRAEQRRIKKVEEMTKSVDHLQKLRKEKGEDAFKAELKRLDKEVKGSGKLETLNELSKLNAKDPKHLAGKDKEFVEKTFAGADRNRIIRLRAIQEIVAAYKDKEIIKLAPEKQGEPVKKRVEKVVGDLVVFLDKLAINIDDKKNVVGVLKGIELQQMDTMGLSYKQKIRITSIDADIEKKTGLKKGDVLDLTKVANLNKYSRPIDALKALIVKHPNDKLNLEYLGIKVYRNDTGFTNEGTQILFSNGQGFLPTSSTKVDPGLGLVVDYQKSWTKGQGLIVESGIPHVSGPVKLATYSLDRGKTFKLFSNIEDYTEVVKQMKVGEEILIFPEPVNKHNGILLTKKGDKIDYSMVQHRDKEYYALNGPGKIVPIKEAKA